MNKVEIVPLGGLGEIGKNMTVIRYEDEIYIVDAGMSFPDPNMLGVDVVIPDFDYLRKNKGLIKKIFITHAHEDHIGALPYFLKEFNVPVYATKLTAALIRNKLRGSKRQINIISENTRLKENKIEISFFATNHSIPDSVGVVFETPEGNIVHTGDFKIDYTPIDKKYFDFQRLGEIGKKGVLALLSDSTNAEKPGVSISETVVKENLEDAIRKCKGRVIVATFGSSLHRVPGLFEIAKNLGRKVAVFGRSMEDGVKIASKLGYFGKNLDVLITEKDLKNYEPHELLIVTTGAQGEPTAGLNRMANGLHKVIQLVEGDTVVFSSSVIPGNEKSVGLLINTLLKKKVKLAIGKELHTSGHGYQEEQKLMLSVLRPKFFIPVHGEYRMLLKHGEIAKQVGIKNVLICENGDIIHVSKENAIIQEKTKAEDILVDNSGLGDVNTSILKDRKRMANHGVVVPQIECYIGTKTKVKVNVTFKGIVARYDKVIIHKEIEEIVLEKLKNITALGKLRKELIEEIGEIIYKHVKRKPMIVPAISIFKK